MQLKFVRQEGQFIDNFVLRALPESMSTQFASGLPIPTSFHPLNAMHNSAVSVESCTPLVLRRVVAPAAIR